MLAKTTHARRTEAIQEQCLSKLKPLGGGDIRVGCSTSHDTKRASKAEGADSVMVAYKIGDTAPASTNDGTTKATYSKATFTINCGDENTGKKLFLFTRWFDTKNPALAGPWSSLNSSGIL
ncbi:MAG: hypothetical protein JJE25_03785 [Bacteroidia bacterium]|nr:hypothetical protein [Bacteroidia bacterium]